MTSFLRRLFRRGQSTQPDTIGESFAARFHRFKLFLSAHIEAYSEMMTLEERLAGEMPLGMPFLRMCTAKLTISTMQCIMQLNVLGKGRYARLNAPFTALRASIMETLNKGVEPLEGPLVISQEEASEEYAALISPNFVKLGAIRNLYPAFIPQGFIVTGAAWWQYFNNPDMHDEIDRIMVISQDDPGSYSEAGATIRERMLKSFPLPESLDAAVRHALEDIRPYMEKPGYTLLVRCVPVRLEHGALVMPEQVLRTPIDTAAVVAAVQSGLAMSYQARAMIYRLKRGIRDRAMPFCLSVSLIPTEHGRGSAHRKLETLGAEELFVHIRRGLTAPEAWPSQASVEGATLPENVQRAVEARCREALTCLADAPVRGNRHEIYWVASESGEFYVLGVNALPDPEEAAERLPLPENQPAKGASGTSECKAGVFLEGGFSTYPGIVRGRVALVRNLSDALNFPIGSILVLPQAAPRWTFLLDFAAGAVTGDGTGNGLFARTARRYGRPTILGQPAAFAQLVDGQEICLMASADHTPVICSCPADGEENSPSMEAEQAIRLQDGDALARGAEYSSRGQRLPLWLPSSDIANMARELAPKVVSLSLPDADNADFRAENCTTYHDFLTYCHDLAVQEMFRSGTSRKTTQAPAKQLVCDVPKQFWIINLDDGFYGELKGPVVQLDQIASLPMRSLWEGFSDKPWDGPPQLDAKGFLSVLFEATANPNLDPASQSTQYTEKNVFLIAKRFCSMRCRFGFHFLSLDCLLGERPRERFVVFQFKGGAANLRRRVRRVHFVAELLAQFDFATEIVGDTLTARLEQGSEDVFLSALRVVGYLVMHTRQLDMIMGDEEALAIRRFQMLEDMLTLAARPPLQLP